MDDNMYGNNPQPQGYENPPYSGQGYDQQPQQPYAQPQEPYQQPPVDPQYQQGYNPAPAYDAPPPVMQNDQAEADATKALWFSIAAFFCCGFMCIPALIFAGKAKKAGCTSGKVTIATVLSWIAIASMVLGVIGYVIVFIVAMVNGTSSYYYY